MFWLFGGFLLSATSVLVLTEKGEGTRYQSEQGLCPLKFPGQHAKKINPLPQRSGWSAVMLVAAI